MRLVIGLISVGCSYTHQGNDTGTTIPRGREASALLLSPLSTVLSGSVVVTEPGNEALPENLPKIKLCLVTAVSRP